MSAKSVVILGIRKDHKNQRSAQSVKVMFGRRANEPAAAVGEGGEEVMRHNCNIDGYGRRNAWQECTACGGRIHEQGCTSKLNPKKDCCRERHQNFIAQGQLVGIDDSAVTMTWWQDRLPCHPDECPYLGARRGDPGCHFDLQKIPICLRCGESADHGLR